MPEVNIYIETDIPPMKRCRGNAIYILETGTVRGNATATKWIPMESATQNRITLEALEEALSRISKPCYITIYTDCQYVANALRNQWITKWQQDNWKNSKGKEICDVANWQGIAEASKQHTITVMPNKGSTYQEWMCTELRRAQRDLIISK